MTGSSPVHSNLAHVAAQCRPTLESSNVCAGSFERSVMGWKACCCARSLACAATGCAASTKRSGDWKTHESTRKASVCQPLTATPRCTQRCAPGPKPTAATHRSIQALSRRSEVLHEFQEYQDAWLLGGLQVADLLEVGQQGIPSPELGKEAYLGGVHKMVEHLADAGDLRPRCQLGIDVEQRDGPVAG